MGCCGCYKRLYDPQIFSSPLKPDDWLTEDISRMSPEKILQILENTPAEDLILALLIDKGGRIVLPLNYR